MARHAGALAYIRSKTKKRAARQAVSLNRQIEVQRRSYATIVR